MFCKLQARLTAALLFTTSGSGPQTPASDLHVTARPKNANVLNCIIEHVILLQIVQGHKLQKQQFAPDSFAPHLYSPH